MASTSIAQLIIKRTISVVLKFANVGFNIQAVLMKTVLELKDMRNLQTLQHFVLYCISISIPIFSYFDLLDVYCTSSLCVCSRIYA